MGRAWSKAIESAGLADVAQRALQGQGLSASDLARVRAADVLLVAGMADAVRAAHRGDEVKLFGPDAARQQPELVKLQLDGARADGPTGQELLLEVALARLTTPAAKSIAVHVDQVGLQLAQVALAFGADALISDLGSKRTLPLLEGPAARREELTGLLERAGRSVRFVETPAAQIGDQP